MGLEPAHGRLLLARLCRTQPMKGHHRLAARRPAWSVPVGGGLLSHPISTVTGMVGEVQGSEAELPGWRLRVYPEAREAAGVFRASFDQRPGWRGNPGEAVNPERCQDAAASRARGKFRRYTVANQLTRMGDVTYRGSGCQDPLELREDMATFFRNVRAGLGGRRIPYVWVPEWHKTDHGLHAHYAFGRYVRRSLLEAAWGRGFVHIQLIGDLPVGSTAVDEARQAARYLAKYIGKDFDKGRMAGLHRYEVGQGFQPREVVVRGVTLGEAIAHASEVMGGRPAEVSLSDEWPNWTGPSAVGLKWGA